MAYPERLRLDAESPEAREGPVGWVCPVCRHVWAPMEPECIRCAVRLDPPPRPVPEEARLTVRLPPPMGCPGYRQVSRLAGEWREVFPGLQARIPDEGTVQADVDFRLTPQDGQEHD